MKAAFVIGIAGLISQVAGALFHFTPERITISFVACMVMLDLLSREEGP